MCYHPATDALPLMHCHPATDALSQSCHGLPHNFCMFPSPISVTDLQIPSHVNLCRILISDHRKNLSERRSVHIFDAISYDHLYTGVKHTESILTGAYSFLCSEIFCEPTHLISRVLVVTSSNVVPSMTSHPALVL